MKVNSDFLPSWGGRELWSLDYSKLRKVFQIYEWPYSLSQEDLLEKEMATHSSILAWRYHGQRSLVGYSSWGHKESDMTERLSLSSEVIIRNIKGKVLISLSDIQPYWMVELFNVCNSSLILNKTGFIQLLWQIKIREYISKFKKYEYDLSGFFFDQSSS